MKFLIGLGNPGAQYQNTRHNAGFMFAELMREQLHLPGWVMMKKTNSLISKNSEWMLIQPQQFMNQSGLAVRGVLDYYLKFGSLSSDQKKELLHSMYVAHDDLDLVVGSNKLQFGKGPKVHNGLKSMYEHLGSNEFWHIRLGVDGRSQGERQQGRDYVLEDFMPDQKVIFSNSMTEISKKVLESAQK